MQAWKTDIKINMMTTITIETLQKSEHFFLKAWTRNQLSAIYSKKKTSQASDLCE